MAEDCRAQNGPGAPVFQIIHLQAMFEKVLSQIFVKRIFSREIGFSMTTARAIFRDSDMFCDCESLLESIYGFLKATGTLQNSSRMPVYIRDYF